MNTIKTVPPKITVKADCGNSPKMQLLKRFNTAFAEDDAAFIMDHVTDDVTWNVINQEVIQGKAQFEQAIKEMGTWPVIELTIHSIITHGKEGAVNGTLTMENQQQYAFCDVYQFNNAKGERIKAMTSYVIEIKE